MDKEKWLERLKAQHIGNDVVIDRTEVPTGKCEMCGENEELRPYGPKGEWVCFDCAMKDEEAAKRQLRRIVFGKSIN